MLRVGLTGGIAAGKSTVAGRFRELGVPVLDADRIAHELSAPGGVGLAALTRELGGQFLDQDGHLDRARLRRAVFADDALRRRVERVLHPLILERLQEAAASLEGPYCILDIPLLTESAAARKLVDRVLVVDCDPQTQIARLIRRDAGSEAQARRMLAAQASRETRLALADDLIRNDGSLDELDRQVQALDTRYRQLASGTEHS